MNKAKLKTKARRFSVRFEVDLLVEALDKEQARRFANGMNLNHNENSECISIVELKEINP